MSYEDDDEENDEQGREQMLAGRSPAMVRDEILRQHVLPWAREHFKQLPEVRSILIGVSQYWADEADDAVHQSSVFSTAETPRWPHHCQREDEDEDDDDAPRRAASDDDFCWLCSDRGGHLDGWDDNGEAIAAFEMFCHEEGSQEEDDNHNTMPYAVLRRASDGDIDVEIVGRVVRGWLERAAEPIAPVARDERLEALYRQVYEHLDDDGPRHVLADELQHRGDPLGEYLALALHPAPTRPMRARAEALLAAGREAWMGALRHVVPAGACQFVRGFPTRVAVHYDERGYQGSSAAEVWRTVETLRFLPGCHREGLPDAPSLRELGPLDHSQLVELGRRPARRLEQLELAVDDEAQGEALIHQLGQLELPSLRALVLEQAAPKSTLAKLARTSLALDLLELRTRDAAVILPWLEARRTTRRLAFCAAPFGWPSGFRLTHDAAASHVLEVELVALDRDSDAQQLGELIAQLPRSLEEIRLQPSRWWTPLASELELLRRLTGRRVVVAA